MAHSFYPGQGPIGGANPAFGRDNGPPPPTAGRNGMGMPGMNLPGGIPMQQSSYYYHGGMYSGGQPYYSYNYGAGGGHPGMYTFAPTHPVFAATTSADGQPRWYQYTSGAAGSSRPPQSHPVINPNMPAAHMTNSTGGVGCEPGYNYFFPAEHTKIHVLKSHKPPWQLAPNWTVPFHACHVPVTTTIADLMKGFGATNANPQKNTLTEVCFGGNGRWYRGVTFGGDNEAGMKKTCKELGWDRSRTGLPGGKPVVYLWVTKD